MIFGIQKLSLVDYPKHPSFVIFLGGCNFACPFCHNASIVLKEATNYDTDSVLNLIKVRKDFLDGVVVTGGEPTIYGQKLIELLRQIKTLGLAIKLDTNGTHPEIIKQILDENLVDYLAMDLKNTFDKYAMTAGVKVSIPTIKESIRLLENSGIEYEFRTTINKTMHKKEDLQEIKTYLTDPSRWFLQPYHYNEQQLEKTDFLEYNEIELNEFHDLLQDDHIRV